MGSSEFLGKSALARSSTSLALASGIDAFTHGRRHRNHQHLLLSRPFLPNAPNKPLDTQSAILFDWHGNSGMNVRFAPEERVWLPFLAAA